MGEGQAEPQARYTVLYEGERNGAIAECSESAAWSKRNGEVFKNLLLIQKWEFPGRSRTTFLQKSK